MTENRFPTPLFFWQFSFKFSGRSLLFAFLFRLAAVAENNLPRYPVDAGTFEHLFILVTTEILLHLINTVGVV